MKKYVFSLIIFLIVGCGGGSTMKGATGDYFKYQWNINPSSIYYSNGEATRGADINLTLAWQHNKGGGVKVAVIDDCFDTSDEDLRDNIYKTYNVNTGLSYVGGNNCHGTEVAGVFGASDNGFGIVGVSPKVELILISFDFNNTSDKEIASGFDYAKNQGAKVINCSWGSEHTSQTLSNKLKDMKNANITVVFASGNGDANNTKINLDENGIDDESEDSSVIGVGATNERNDVTYYSNYGSNIDILAPGGSNIGILTTQDKNNYSYVVGTSFSAPTVSGIIALMYAKTPNLTFDEIYQKITQTTDQIGGTSADYNASGFDTYRAYGKINAGNALN